MIVAIKPIRACGCTRAFLAALFSSLIFYSAGAQSRGENLDEAKVASYTLPDLLKTANGKNIMSAKEWTITQRPAVLQLFRDHVYGKLPGKPKGLRFKVNAVDNEALGGMAIRKQITVLFTQAADAPGMEVLLYIPKEAKKPVPVFTGLNFYGNHTVNADPGITLSTRWIRRTRDSSVVNHKTTETARGTSAKSWEIGKNVITGGKYLRDNLSPNGPVYRAYQLYNDFAGRSSWDQIAVFLLLDESKKYFDTVTNGYCQVKEDGSNQWMTDKDSPYQEFVVFKPNANQKELAKTLDDMVLHMSKRK